MSTALQVVQGHPLPGAEFGHPWPKRLDRAGDLVAERERKPTHGRDPGTVVSVGVADPGGAYPDQHLVGARPRSFDLLHHQRRARRDHPQGLHPFILLHGLT